MCSFELIGNIVKLKKFAPVVDLKWADSLGEGTGFNLIDNYIVTTELASYFEKVLEGFTLTRHEKRALREGNILDASTHPRSFILRGQYGTGKSYFLLMMSVLLESLENHTLFNEVSNKFSMFEGIRHHMDLLRQNSAKYLVVRIDGAKNIDTRFFELVQKSVILKIEKALGEHDINDSYTIAVQKLEEYKYDPVFSKLLDDELERRSLSYDSIVNGLKASKRKSLKQYKEVMEAITRHRIDEGFDSLDAFLRSASSYIKSKGYKGIVILFDEFSAYVSASIEDERITADLAAIQSLAQLTVPREEQDLFFICSMHVDIGRILRDVMVVAEEVQKVRGRFCEMTLSFNNSENIVENILSVDKAGFARIQEKYQKYFGALPARYPNMDRVYPIHPHAIPSIIKVSGRFAQNERTIFSFFAEAVNRKLGEPVVKDERLNLVTTREIYDYFIDTISEKNISIRDSAFRCLSFCASELERDVIKALVIAHVSAGVNADSRLSPKDIAFIVGTGDIREIDIFLKGLSVNPLSNIIFYEKEYRFEFIAGGQMVSDVLEKMNEIKARVNGYEALLETLREYDSSICIRKSYTVNPSKDIMPVRKDLAGMVYRPADLLKSISQEISNIEKDGKLIFIVPSFDETISEDFIEKTAAALEKAPSNVCIAIPRHFPFHLEEDLKSYHAIKSILDAGRLDENGRKTLAKMLQPYKNKIEEEIKKFACAENFTFVFNNNIIEVFPTLEELEKFILHRHFSKFPRSFTEPIRSKNSIHALVENFIAFGEKTNIPANYSSETDKLIMDVLRPLDMVKVERSGFGYAARLKIPEESKNPASYEIWRIVNDTSRPVQEVFNVLREAPYGLPDYMVELYIAAAVASNQLEIRYKGQAVQLNKMSIAFVSSEGYSLEKVRTASVELKRSVKRVWTVFSKIHSHSSVRYFEPEMPQRDADIASKITEDMNSVKALLDGMEARLDNAGIKNTAMLNLMNALDELMRIKSPFDFIEKFVALPETAWGIDDYETAFKNYEQFLDFVVKLGRHIDEIRRVGACLDRMRCVEGVQQGYDELKDLYYDTLASFDSVKKNINNNICSEEDIKKLGSNLRKLVFEYNREFVKLHENVNRRIHSIYAVFESPAVNLIENLEKIDFKNIKKISEVRSDLKNIRACPLKPMERDDEPIDCVCTGYQEGLLALVERVHLLGRTDESTQRQIVNIGNNYVLHLLELDEIKDDCPVTFRAYLEKSCGSKAKGGRAGGASVGSGASDASSVGDANSDGGAISVGGASDVGGANDVGGTSGVSNTCAVDQAATALKDWDELKKYLHSGFEKIVSEESRKDSIRLLSGILPYINNYLAYCREAARKKDEVKPGVKKKIRFRTLYERIQSEISNSGYKSVSIEEFAHAIRSIIERLKEEYDEVDIDG